MKSLFQRVLPKSFRSDPVPAVSVPAPVLTTFAPTDVVPPPAPAAKPVSTSVRRPLIASSGDVAGFEFRFDEVTVHQLLQARDEQAITDHVAALLVAARLVTLDGRVGFARLPVAWLPYAAVPKDEPGTVIGLEPGPAALSHEQLQAVVSSVGLFQFAGARLAWGADLDLGLPPDYVLLRQTGASVADLLASAHALPVALQHKPLIVTDLANLEDLEQVLHGGASFVSGALASKVAPEPAPPKDPKALRPELRNVTSLLRKLAAEANSEEIISDLKGDIGLSVPLLQRINSASFAHLGGVASIEQAVAMLGRNELQRWLSLMLMQFAGKRKTSSALQEVALWRARFVELMAAERGEPEPGQFFTLGLASMLGLILKISPAEVVATLGLPPLGQQALLEQTGPWAVYLRTAMDVEQHSLSDERAVGEGFSAAAPVLALSEEAWAWAARHSERGA